MRAFTLMVSNYLPMRPKKKIEALRFDPFSLTSMNRLVRVWLQMAASLQEEFLPREELDFVTSDRNDHPECGF